LADFRSSPVADMPSVTSDVRSQGAGSTGRRNTGVKSLRWGFKLQGRVVVRLTRQKQARSKVWGPIPVDRSPCFTREMFGFF